MKNKNNEKAKSQPLRIGGIGLPMLDCIAPSHQELSAGLALIEAATQATTPLPRDPAQADVIKDMRENGAQKVNEAKAALDTYYEFMAGNQFKLGDKKTLKDTLDPKDPHSNNDKSQNQIALDCFGIIQEAARQINVAAHFLKRPDEQLIIRHLGGTTANKMHAVQSALGAQVETHMLGLVGDEDENGNRARVLKEMESSGIAFHQFTQSDGEPVSLGHMALGYIYQGTDSETGKKDRTALKSPTPDLDKLLSDPEHVERVNQFANTPPLDMYLVESSDLSPKKFGARLFQAFSDRVIHSHKPIMLGLPTDLSLILPDPKKPKHSAEELAQLNENRVKMDALVNAKNTVFIGSNEEEAVAMFCHAHLDKSLTPVEMKDGKNVKVLHQHPQVLEARDALQARLKAKTEPGKVEPIGFISVGVEGVWGVTPTMVKFFPGTPHKAPVNNIGCGDGLYGGAVARYIQTVLRPMGPAQKVPLHFTEDALESILNCGQNIAHHVVGQKGSQLPAATIQTLVHGAPLTHGQVVSVSIPEPSLEQKL